MDMITMIRQLGSGMVVTIQIFMVTLLFALPLGMIIAFGRMSKNIVICSLTKLYIAIMRGTPLMLQLMVVYFGPYYLFGIKITSSYRLTAVLIGFVINYAAYYAEIYRSGFISIPIGQYEAAKVLGYNKIQTFLKIILPQVVKRVLPTVTNEMITLVKDTSLAFVIAVSEMFTQAQKIASAQTTMTPFIIAAIFYFIFNCVIAYGMERVEKKLNYYQ
ncbi:MAG: amino acid ABC transporter permease [Eubacteriales bacterium]